METEWEGERTRTGRWCSMCWARLGAGAELQTSIFLEYFLHILFFGRLSVVALLHFSHFGGPAVSVPESEAHDFDGCFRNGVG